jgi:hypothetical protein
MEAIEVVGQSPRTAVDALVDLCPSAPNYLPGNGIHPLLTAKRLSGHVLFDPGIKISRLPSTKRLIA